MPLMVTTVKPRAFCSTQDPDTLPERVAIYADEDVGRIWTEYRVSIGEAVEADHRCGDLESCDICNALDADFPLAAAHLLAGATECATLEAVGRAYFWNYGDNLPMWTDEFEEWCEYHAETWPEERHRCGACGSYTYLPDRPSECAQCSHPFPVPPECEACGEDCKTDPDFCEDCLADMRSKRK